MNDVIFYKIKFFQLILYQYSLEISHENFYFDIGAKRVNKS